MRGGRFRQADFANDPEGHSEQHPRLAFGPQWE